MSVRTSIASRIGSQTGRRLARSMGGQRVTKPMFPKPGVRRPLPAASSLATTPATPAAPAITAPAATPIPSYKDAAYDGTVNGAWKAYNDQLAGISTQEKALKQDYGLEDTSNPFSKAKLLQQSYDRARATTTTNMASGRQLYSGAMQNAQNDNTRSFLQSSDTLKRNYQAAKNTLAQQRKDAENDRNQRVIDAEAAAMERALATRANPDDIAPAAPAPPTIASLGIKVPTAPKGVNPASFGGAFAKKPKKKKK